MTTLIHENLNEFQANYFLFSYRGLPDLNKLFESIEIAIPDYRRSHIIVIQKAGNIIKCEYYERGTSRSLRSNLENALTEYRFSKTTHESEMTKDFPSAHYRRKLILCNVATCFSQCLIQITKPLLLEKFIIGILLSRSLIYPL
ncbi:hypothetical protein [Coxiella endosymbiont of Ornithodoros amblus]|uniref:hypothetical protein n=1 Tax=Coxiella endosymbiont of Ornithodoros amblus TaxID=1656166 RepID=UPI00244DCB3B|nr:hypothetical protein [Coxiella endosymbiont of Ornithodoros amblus]